MKFIFAIFSHLLFALNGGAQLFDDSHKEYLNNRLPKGILNNVL